MTLAFMVLAAPRSATTWMANFLTTDTTLCMHDALVENKRSLLDRIVIPGIRLGISDTCALAFPEWLEGHPARKIVIWRDPNEINASLKALGLAEISPQHHAARVEHAVEKCGAKLYEWTTLWREPTMREICKHLGVPFIQHRYDHLKYQNIQPQFARLPIDREAVQELVQRIAKEVQS